MEGNLESVVTWGLALLAVFGLLLFVGRQMLAIFAPRRRYRRRPDPTRHLRYVLDADFVTAPVMQRAEYRVFRVVENEALALGRGYRVFSQTALGAVLKTDSSQAFWAVNSKRVDVLVIGRNGEPVLAVEYQGSGHHQNDAAARDAVKREALRKAGVKYLEVFEHSDVEETRRAVRKALGPAAAFDGAAVVVGPWEPPPRSTAMGS